VETRGEGEEEMLNEKTRDKNLIILSLKVVVRV
jgi:hypothetical protein